MIVYAVEHALAILKEPCTSPESAWTRWHKGLC